MSSICRLIVRENSFLPITKKTFAFYRRKRQVCLFADRNARFGPVLTDIVPGGCDTPYPPVGSGLFTLCRIVVIAPRAFYWIGGTITSCKSCCYAI